MSISRTPEQTWQVRWRDPGHRQRSRTFKRKIDAEQFEAKVRHELATGDYIDPRAQTAGSVGRFIGRVGQVLYVGVTDDLFHRMATHRRKAPWWPQMHRLEWEQHPDRAQALQREAALIANRRSAHNFVGKPGRRPA